MTADGSQLEIEIKLQVASVEEGMDRLAHLPARLEEAPRLEDNEVYDTSDSMLSNSSSLLRLRVVGDQGMITFKEKVPSALHAKVRLEHECTVSHPTVIRKIFSKIGLSKVYRYQKYRSYHAWNDPETGALLDITVDDTPIGVFVELEGPKDTIDRAARIMGYSSSDYILDDYHALHRAWLKREGQPAGDMVFEDATQEAPEEE